MASVCGGGADGAQPAAIPINEHATASWASLANADSHYDQGQTRRFGAVERHRRLRYAAPRFIIKLVATGGDGVPPSEGRLVMVPKAMFCGYI
jgi:hypothetical protein